MSIHTIYSFFVCTHIAESKILALILATLLVLSMVSAFAASTATETGTGSLTVQSSSGTVSVAGRTFRAYKILGIASASNDYSNIAYTVPAYMVPFFTNNTASGLDLDLTGVSTTGPSAKLDNRVADKLSTMQDDDANITAFAEKARAWCADNNIPYYEATGGENATNVQFTNLPLGYYIVDDVSDPSTVTEGNHISAVILDTTTPSVTITVKATTTTSDKSITGFNTGETGETNVQDRQLYVKDEGENQWKVADVSFGDILHYQVDSIVPDVRGYSNYKFVMRDTLGKGLKLDKSTIKVTIGEDVYTAASGDLTVTTDPETPTGAATTSLTIVLKDALAKFSKTGVNKGDGIAITYDVELTTDALVGNIPNENEVYIDYSNNPKNEGEGDTFGPNEPHGTTPQKKTKTFVTEIKIIKVDENGNPLAGAGFTMTGTRAHKVAIYEDEFVIANDGTGTHWLLADGTYTTTNPQTPNIDTSKYDPDHINDKYKLQRKTTFETKVEGTDTIYKVTPASGVITFSGLSEGTYHFEETTVPTGYNGIDPFDVVITFAYDPQTQTGDFSSSSANVTKNSDGTFQIQIQNNKGTELPSTGGMGTTILYVGGSILVILAAVLLITKRRMGSED